MRDPYLDKLEELIQEVRKSNELLADVKKAISEQTESAQAVSAALSRWETEGLRVL